MDAGYRVADLFSDLVALMEAAGFERSLVFGYSFTGACGPWLARSERWASRTGTLARDSAHPA
jgi:hypothetical protein